jgi:hypothetical protein
MCKLGSHSLIFIIASTGKMKPIKMVNYSPSSGKLKNFPAKKKRKRVTGCFYFQSRFAKIVSFLNIKAQ